MEFYPRIPARDSILSCTNDSGNKSSAVMAGGANVAEPDRS